MILQNNEFNLLSINKYASVMALGNGYLGLRSSYEEHYTEQTRGMYVAGVFNKSSVNEISELVNLPDVVGMKMEIDGECFSLLAGEVQTYKRYLNLSTGELIRDFIWKNRNGARFQFQFQRFVGKDNLHLLASRMTIIALDQSASIKIVTGIDGQQTNFGKQHLIEESARVYDAKVMQTIYSTSHSDLTIAMATYCQDSVNSTATFSSKNRQLLATFKHDLSVQEPYIFEKICTVYTSLDNDLDGKSPAVKSIETLEAISGLGYDCIFDISALKWKEFWNQSRVNIKTKQDFDQLAMDFALYHMEIMTPAHDKRLSVGAKGLTGEGYKGHVFWDTEIFILPFHLFTKSDKAKKLLQYRYMRLEQAKDKASRNGYMGALFPWESAWTGEEETPEYAAINIRTGKRQKIASALAEHHIVADIAFAVVQYYQNTKDDEFMRKEGLSLLKETANFWISRSEKEAGKIVIKNVIGPDEYTEHIDNNAFTNYMAHDNVKQALFFMSKFNEHDPLLDSEGRKFLKLLYLPQPNENKIIPQDDTFLSKPEIDLTNYKESQGSQAILLDYSRQEIIDMQILKQADVVMLLYLFPHLFSADVVEENLRYYEKHTIHDSSLSKAIHAIVAARCGHMELAYRFFQEACLIDLGPNPHSSDEGIHAASLGSLWLSAIFGFANISIEEDHLSINPHLPLECTELEFPFHCLGRELNVKLTHEYVEVFKKSGTDLDLKINENHYVLKDKINVTLL